MTLLTKVTQKPKWLLTCMVRSFDQQRFFCPNCGSNESVLLDRKFIVSHLRKCSNCKLRFRTPTDTPQNNEKYYQDEYSLGFTTSLPDEKSLKELLRSNFENHEKSYKSIIDILKLLKPENSILFDFGCSWGYGSWQLKGAGFSVQAYEISRLRARYAAEKLNIDLIDLRHPPSGFDIFFSNHVLEHVPSPSQTIALARKILKPDGIFVALTPNGSDAYRYKDFPTWHLLWGQDHPNHLSDEFYQHEFTKNPFFLSSTPSDCATIIRWNQAKDQVILPCLSPELLLITYPNLSICQAEKNSLSIIDKALKR